MRLRGYSSSSERARAFLLSRYNPFDLYVEDTAGQNVYVRMVNQILGSRGQITHVFPLGGRDNVLARCRADQAPQERRRLYLIDADLDLLVGRRAPRLKYLHRLPVYCVENLLLSEVAILQIAAECQVNAKLSDLRNLLAIQVFLRENARRLLPLFIVYAACSQLHLGIETSSYPVVRLLERPSDPHSLSDSLIRSRIFSVIRAIVQHGRGEAFRRERDRITLRVRQQGLDPEDYVSGKTYLFPLIHLLLKGSVGLTDKADRLKVRFSSNYEVSKDIAFARKIRGLLP